ncbi:phosphatase PAP2 family protein [Campylobacter jejuni]|uniref:Phosphatase PAP2 family protein n=1 Tax=Campylobacter jejuni TaxID=197 RepID=A0A5Y9K968_CAMJU|nr:MULTISPECIES: phosphatase PAP2 family protein [Campylobacter]EAI0803873.1 phosphatase PAP2 family protein [Campylobacter jejuni]EAI4882973.1 phosphatase PAP2 family protein [Campylobacter jejuni]EAI6602419.1 phosphatase PAP2 family protein [Campylobacter jejuni]EAI7325423.1 phosphatase PAP2 family protein [Campylobacter jejuni]EAJ3319913.1 phosphatase PAP2 family protein [Campylobacter jejuni]
MKIFNFFLIFVLFSNLSANIFDDKEQARKTGDIVQIAVPLYAFGLLFYNDDFKDGILPYALSFAATQGSVEILKRVVKEERPDGSDNLSFPSGHSAAAFWGATFIHKRYGFKQAIVPYILASYVGYSRVKADKHYTRDVVAGAAIAGLWNYFLVDRAPNIMLEPRSDGFFLRYAKNF